MLLIFLNTHAQFTTFGRKYQVTPLCTTSRFCDQIFTAPECPIKPECACCPHTSLVPDGGQGIYQTTLQVPEVVHRQGLSPVIVARHAARLKSLQRCRNVWWQVRRHGAGVNAELQRDIVSHWHLTVLPVAGDR